MAQYICTCISVMIAKRKQLVVHCCGGSNTPTATIHPMHGPEARKEGQSLGRPRLSNSGLQRLPTAPVHVALDGSICAAQFSLYILTLILDYYSVFSDTVPIMQKNLGACMASHQCPMIVYECMHILFFSY